MATAAINADYTAAAATAIKTNFQSSTFYFCAFSLLIFVMSCLQMILLALLLLHLPCLFSTVTIASSS